MEFDEQPQEFDLDFGEVTRTGGGGGAVNSVNGKTGDVVLDAEDVGALPNSTVIPTKTSELENDGADGTSTYVEADELATVATSGKYTDLTDTPSLASVATSGKYTDLTDTPTIPSTASDVGALPDSTKYGKSIEASGTTLTLKDQDGEDLATATTQDTTYSNFTGTDGQTAGASGLVPAPATTDAGKFLKADGTWDTAGGGSSSPFKELTTADYNYPTNNPNSVALWKLDPGIYYKADNVTARTDVNNLLTTNLNTIVVGGPIDSGANTIILAFGSAAVNGIPKEFSEFVTNITTGAKSESDSFVPYRYVRNNLTAGSAGYVLDARQGKELKRLIDELDQRVTALGG